MRLITYSLFIASAAIAGCAAPSKYSWGDYEKSLYSYYKDPTKAPELAVALEKNILAAEQTQKPVAPGLYAEYGYVLMQQGKSKEAVAYFEKEKSKWPESVHLMNTMIQTAMKAPIKAAEAKQP
jgi:hypothetical protein